MCGLVKHDRARPDAHESLYVKFLRYRPPHAYVTEFKSGTDVMGLQVMLAAVHPWDTHGAKAAGLQTAFINRNEEEYPPYFLQPDVDVPSFEALAELLYTGMSV